MFKNVTLKFVHFGTLTIALQFHVVSQSRVVLSYFQDWGSKTDRIQRIPINFLQLLIQDFCTGAPVGTRDRVHIGAPNTRTFLIGFQEMPRKKASENWNPRPSPSANLR